MPQDNPNGSKARKDFADLIEVLQVDDMKKDALRSRWLDQVNWMSGRAKHAKKWYYRLRISAILGGLLIPALVNLNVGDKGAEVARWTVFGLGLVVAITGALEEFFRYGDRWRHYRQNVEALKTEGWQFFQLVGAYASDQYPSHADAYPKFATKVEEILASEVGVYVAQVEGQQPPPAPVNLEALAPKART